MTKNAFIGLFVAVSLVGAGGLFAGHPVDGGGNRALSTGIIADTRLAVHLQTEFAQVQACTGLPEGEFTQVTVVLTDPEFPCRWYDGGCSGEFVAPATIRLGQPHVWQHEVIHYLLYVNTGSADGNHHSDLFVSCS